MTSSGLSQLVLGDYTLSLQGLLYKLQKWSLKDVADYQRASNKRCFYIQSSPTKKSFLCQFKKNLLLHQELEKR